MSIKALIWDLEGVLLITSDDTIEQALARRLNVPVEAIGKIFHGEFNDRVDIGEFTQHDFWLHALDILGMPHSRLPDLEAFFNEDFFIDQDMVERVRQYHRRFKTALLSNYSDVLRPMLESRWKMDGAFDEIIISWEVKIIKPDPAIFDLALERLAVTKEEAVLIDDRIVNIRGADSYGLHTVYFQNKQQGLHDLDKIIARYE